MDSINPQIAFEYWQGKRLNNKLRRGRQKFNPYEMTEADFMSYYRFPPALAKKLIRELEALRHTQKQQPDVTTTVNPEEKYIPFDMKCLITLNFYATGSYQNHIHSIRHISDTVISKVIEEVTDLLNILMTRYIIFPQDEVERNRIAGEFAKKGIPGIIGLIDGMHIPLTGLSNKIEMAYMNRNRFHSINAQIVVNDRNLITYVNARYPGSVDDCFIWGASQLYAMFQNEYTTPKDHKYWILGNQSYPLMPFLITAREQGTTAQQQEFYRRHKIIYSQVERTISLLKNRFRCIHGERKLYFAPVTCAKIINAVALCHNFLILNGYKDENDTHEDGMVIANAVKKHIHRGNNPYLKPGRFIRKTIINNIVL